MERRLNPDAKSEAQELSERCREIIGISLTMKAPKEEVEALVRSFREEIASVEDDGKGILEELRNYLESVERALEQK